MTQSGLRAQAGKPTGVVGKIFGFLMNLSNREDNSWTVSLLGINTTSKVLEIGFGTGLAIAEATKINTNGCIYGVEHSETMLEAAENRNQKAIKAGRVSLRLGSVMKLPFEDNYFDIVYSINCIYFWEPPIQGLTEIYRVLKPGGIVAITARNRNDEEVYARLNPDAVSNLLQSTGFVHTKAVDGLNPKHPIYCAMSNKPTNAVEYPADSAT
jgi:ubiquinone/menaquinone biosynthesis C-methylase UbiE